jgi:hypothetical protein
MLIEVQGQSFNTESLKGFDEQMFFKAFQGKVKCDIHEAWKQVKKHIESPPKKTKPKTKRKKAAE